MNGKKGEKIIEVNQIDKKKKTVIISLIVMALAGLGITLALLTAGPKERVNNFTVLGSEDIDVDIEEEFDEEEAGKMKPNVPVTKEPKLTNTSAEDIDIYVAMQVVFVYGNGSEFDPKEVMSQKDYDKLMDLLYVRYDTSKELTNYNIGTNKWQEVSAAGNGAVYLWQQPVAKGASTEILFRDVMIKTETGYEALDWIKEELGDFDIVIRGAAVQADGVTLTEAADELTALLDLEQIK